MLYRVALILALGFAGSIALGDWPSVRNGPGQRGVADEELVGELELKWEKDAPDGIVASAAIMDGRVYCGTLGGEFWCLDLRTGDEIWTASTTADETGFRPGFNSPPTITETHVLVGDEDGTFYALRRDDGTPDWKRTTGDQIVGGATVVDVGGEPHVLVGSHDGKLYCLNAQTGEITWDFATDGPVNCSVALAESDGKLFTFVAGCDEQLRVIDVATGTETGSMPLGSPLIASPAIAGKTLFVGTYAGEFAAIDWESLESRWQVQPAQSGQPIHSSAAVSESLVVVGGRDRHLRAFDRETGDERWSVRTRSKIDSSPVMSGGRAFVGTGDKRLIAVGLDSGEIEWEFAAGRPISVGPVISNGSLVVGTEGPRGKLLCFVPAQ